MPKPKRGASPPIRFSQTGLDRFMTCPMKYYLGTGLTPKTLSKPLYDGIVVHQLMSGEMKRNDIRASYHHKMIVANLQVQAEGYEWSPVEILEEVEYNPGIIIVRKIDAQGHDPESGKPVLIDWKSTSYGWDLLDGFAPKAMGLQSHCYLIPTSKDYPEEIHYITASAEGTLGIHVCHVDDLDPNDLDQAIDNLKHAKRKGNFPRHAGWLCRFCEFDKACFATSGWKKHYDTRQEEEI